MKRPCADHESELIHRHRFDPGGLWRYVVADLFTSTPLESNQLVVFSDASGLTSEQMQRTPREMNLSEAVLLLPGEENGDAPIRSSTPTRELLIAGYRQRQGF